MFLISLLETAGTGETSGGGLFGGSNTWISIALLVGMFVLFYFLLIRPQRKKEKAAQEMRSSIEVGDGVTTIGGLVGRVVTIKDDTILIETGSDRTKFRIKKWAVQEVEKLRLDE